MKIVKNHIMFGAEDTNFIKKFGLSEALEMVENFRTLNNLPFIYDSLQLAGFLDIPLGVMVRMVRKGCDSLYHPHTIKKKNGGERQLYSPYCVLKRCQSIILRDILMKLPVSKYATAYKPKVSIVDNANPHIGKKYLLKMDITDFFDSISFEQVYCAAFNTRYFPKHIGVILTNLCCRNDSLPQGAPTSPAISNIVMKNFDNNVGKWCEERGISYTRYCDDLTFSSDKPLYHLYVKVKKMLYNMNFEVNENKTRFVTSASRQSVTGITVNQKLTVSREYKRELRQKIYYVLKFGVKSSLAYETNGFLGDDVNAAATHMLNVLIGKINYLLSVEKGEGNNYFKKAKGILILMRDELE